MANVFREIFETAAEKSGFPARNLKIPLEGPDVLLKFSKFGRRLRVSAEKAKSFGEYPKISVGNPNLPLKHTDLRRKTNLLRRKIEKFFGTFECSAENAP